MKTNLSGCNTGNVGNESFYRKIRKATKTKGKGGGSSDVIQLKLVYWGILRIDHVFGELASNRSRLCVRFGNDIEFYSFTQVIKQWMITQFDLHSQTSKLNFIYFINNNNPSYFHKSYIFTYITSVGECMLKLIFSTSILQLTHGVL